MAPDIIIFLLCKIPLATENEKYRRPRREAEDSAAEAIKILISAVDATVAPHSVRGAAMRPNEQVFWLPRSSSDPALPSHDKTVAAIGSSSLVTAA